MEWRTSTLVFATPSPLSICPCPSRVHCQWRLLGSPAPYPRLSLDLLLSRERTLGLHPVVVTTTDQVSQHLFTGILGGSPNEDVAIRLILPQEPGYIVRSDFLELRLETADHLISCVKGFISPLGEIRPVPQVDLATPHLRTLLTYAIGALTLVNPTIEAFNAVERELIHRLSFAWSLPYPIPRKRVALVTEEVDVAATMRRWNCAFGLGIDVVVISSGDWFPNSHELAFLREGFIKIDLSSGMDLAERIINAVRNYPRPIHGLATVQSRWLVDVARAAEELHLPTSSSEAYQVSCDKYLTRCREEDATSILVTGVEDLKAKMPLSYLTYPLVVKPASGWSSECVFKIHDDEALVEAVGKAAQHQSSGRVLIEAYVDGPEFDINYILLDGDILFSEISDDFPSVGDHLTGSNFSTPNFGETKVVMPTRLPAQECALIQKQLHMSLLTQGFRDGVFHVEGRIINSSMEYRTTGAGGAGVDIEARRSTPKLDLDGQSVYLHEVNARPPGYNSASSSMLVYGIDYWALHILFALHDWDRIKAMAVPFLEGAIGHAMVNNIPVSVDVALVRSLAHSPPDDCSSASMMPVSRESDPMHTVYRLSPTWGQFLRQYRTVVTNGEAYGNTKSVWWWLTTQLLFAHDRRALLAAADQIGANYEITIRELDLLARRES